MWSGGHLSGRRLAVDGRAGRARAERWAWSFAIERSHLNGVVPGERMRGRELDRLLPIGAADDVDAGDELLGAGARPLAKQRVPAADADRRGRARALQRVSQDVKAAPRQVLPPCRALLHRRLAVRWRRGSVSPHDQQVWAGGAVLAAPERGRLLAQPQ